MTKRGGGGRPLSEARARTERRGSADRIDLAGTCATSDARDKQAGHGRRHAGFNERWKSRGGGDSKSFLKLSPTSDELELPVVKRRQSVKRGGFNGKTNALKGREAFRAVTDFRNKRDVWTVATQPFAGAHFATFPPALIEPCILAGSRPGDLVLDPFAGAGTTGMVALRHGRNFLGMELNPEYAEMARRRIADDSPLLNKETT